LYNSPSNAANQQSIFTDPVRSECTTGAMLTIVHLITGLETGGAEGMLARLVAGSDRARFRSVVVSMTRPGLVGQAIVEAGIPLRSLGMRRGVPDPRGLLRLRWILREFRADVLQTWLYHADMLGLAAWRLGWVPRLLWNLRCTESIESPRLRSLLSRWSALPDAVIVNAREVERFHRALGYRPRRWIHIPNGFDTAALRPDPDARRRLRTELSIADDALAILLPARYHPMKDHANFLAAAARFAAAHPAARFVLAGDGTGPDNRPLAAAVAAHGIGDRMLLLGERRDLGGVYPAADIVTLSSAFGEGFPNVLGEAMCRGIPCAATAIGDATEIIGAAGFIAPPRDPVALAAAWERLAALGPDGRRALGIEARARIVENYDLAAIVARYEALYQAVERHAAVPVAEGSAV
jgi:glycosyltransferase involved in cell wall biosynthesis